LKTKNDIDFDEGEASVKEKVETLKCDLLDIELHMQDALRLATDKFTSTLKGYVSDMVEKTSQFLGVECLEEC
jgi:hypothetical protein